MAENNETTEETKDEVKNTVTITDVGPCKKKIAIEIPAETIHAKLDGKFHELRRDVAVPGFRKGRAPIRLVEKRFGTDVSKQVKLELLAAACDAAIKDNDLKILGDPDIDHEKIELPQEGPMKVEFEVEVRPEFDLPELEGIEIEKPKIEVSDKQVDDEVLALRKRLGLWTPKEEGGAEEGDQIIADVVLITEGQPDHDKRENIEITIRKAGFVAGVPVEDLDKLLIGVKHGDEKKTSVSVPETFYDETLRGRKIDLTLSVKEVKTLAPAELNEELFTRLDVENEDDLKDKLRERLSTQAERQARNAMSEQIYAFLRDKIDFDLPSSIVADQAGAVLQRQYTNMLMQGMTKEQVDEQMEQLKLGSEEQAKDQLKLYFIMDKLADKFGVEVTEEEINGHIAYVAAMRGRRPEKMREELQRDGSLAQFTLQIREEKCIEKILGKATIKDVDAVTEKPAKKAAARKTAAKKTAKKDKPQDSVEEAEEERKKTAAKRTKKATKKDNE